MTSGDRRHYIVEYTGNSTGDTYTLEWIGSVFEVYENDNCWQSIRILKNRSGFTCKGNNMPNFFKFNAIVLSVELGKELFEV